MALLYANRGGRIRVTSRPAKKGPSRPIEDVVRQLKAQRDSQSDYREKSLAIHGLICARCGREFEESSRHLLTVHHKDGNHYNNPSDGSNWENLCVYCHEDIHSRGLLGDYLEGSEASPEEEGDSYGGKEKQSKSLGTLGDRLQEAFKKRGR